MFEPLVGCSWLMVEHEDDKTLLYPLNSSLFPVCFPRIMPAVIICICIIILLLLCCWPCYRLMLSFDENVHACCFLKPVNLPRISPWTVSVFLFNAIWGWCLVARLIGPLGWIWFSHDVGHMNMNCCTNAMLLFDFAWSWFYDDELDAYALLFETLWTCPENPMIGVCLCLVYGCFGYYINIVIALLIAMPFEFWWRMYVDDEHMMFAVETQEPLPRFCC